MMLEPPFCSENSPGYLQTVCGSVSESSVLTSAPGVVVVFIKYSIFMIRIFQVLFKDV